MQRDVTQRRDAIIALLSENDMLSAMELSFELYVSVQTIRADLRDLDEAGLVQRRNGTVRLRQQSENTGYLPREGIARQEKQRIALAVKNLIPDGRNRGKRPGIQAISRQRCLTRPGRLGTGVAPGTLRRSPAPEAGVFARRTAAQLFLLAQAPQ